MIYSSVKRFPLYVFSPSRFLPYAGNPLTENGPTFGESSILAAHLGVSTAIAKAFFDYVWITLPSACRYLKPGLSG